VNDQQSEAVERILKAVCDMHGVAREQLLGKTRISNALEARADAFYLLQYVGLASTATASVFGCEHSTVLRALKRREELAEQRKTFIAAIAAAAGVHLGPICKACLRPLDDTKDEAA
jgi:chromosomal replication initiation ATPase DnaA